MSLVDVVRAEFLRGRNLEYVRAARALGMQNGAIMFRHILPNAMVSTMTFMPFILTGAIGTLTALDFLGFGLPAGSPSLGELVARAGPTCRRLARHQRLHGAGDHADPAGVHRGGGARCLRPKEIRCPKFRLARTVEVRDLAVEFVTGDQVQRVVEGVSFDIRKGETSRWWAKAARASRSPHIPSCACCPTRWPATPVERFISTGRT